MSPRYTTVGGYPNLDPYYISPEEEAAMTEYKISATRTGSHETMGDWDADYEITFRVIRHAPGAHEFGGMNPEPTEVVFVSISPDAGDHGAFSDLAQRDLEDWAQGWLDDAGYDDALAVATSKSDAGV